MQRTSVTTGTFLHHYLGECAARVKHPDSERNTGMKEGDDFNGSLTIDSDNMNEFWRREEQS